MMGGEGEEMDDVGEIQDERERTDVNKPVVEENITAQDAEEKIDIDLDDPETEMAATKIQNLWKGAIARRQVKKQREEELAFIGMVN